MNLVEKQVPIIPRNDLVLISMDSDETMSKGGIIMAYGKQARTGTVVAVGPGALSDNIPPPHRMPIGIAVGDRVHLEHAMCGHSFDSDDRVRYVLVPQQAILGVLPS